MSKYFSGALKGEPYTPGEQPKNRKSIIKLNTNENPYPPSPRAVEAVTRATLENLRLYSDPESRELCGAIASSRGVLPRNVIVSNGSDEILAFCFAAFGGRGAAFPDITYGFYKVFADLFSVEYTEIPLKDDFTVPVDEFSCSEKAVFIANPNAQTGIALPLCELRKIIESARNVVVVDEAYADFCGQSAAGLVDEFDNLVVVQTLSKSYALAGARIGYAIASEPLIADLNRVRYSFNPYNVDSVSAAIGIAAVRDEKYRAEICRKVTEDRKTLAAGLRSLGFGVLPSSANFVMAKSPKIGGEELYNALKARGILVRHFSDARIKDFIRITVGTAEQNSALLNELKELTI